MNDIDNLANPALPATDAGADAFSDGQGAPRSAAEAGPVASVEAGPAASTAAAATGAHAPRRPHGKADREQEDEVDPAASSAEQALAQAPAGAAAWDAPVSGPAVASGTLASPVITASAIGAGTTDSAAPVAAPPDAGAAGAPGLSASEILLGTIPVALLGALANSGGSSSTASAPDRQPPVLTVLPRLGTDGGATSFIEAGGLTRDNTVEIRGSVTDAGKVTQVQVFDGSQLLGTAPVAADGSWSFTTGALADGSHAVTVRATDEAGNSVTSGSIAFSVDTAVPTLTVSAPDASTDATPTIRGTSDLPDGATVRLTLTSAGSTVQSFEAIVSNGNYAVDVPSALADGAYTVAVEAVDSAGNRRVASDVGSVDLVNITGTITAGPLVSGHGLGVTALRADGTVLGTGTVAADGSYRIVLSEPYEGLVMVRVVDSGSGGDYRDEATLAVTDLTVDLRAVVLTDGAGDLVVNVTPATELVVLALGLAAGDSGQSSTGLAHVTAAQYAAVSTAVQSALGLPDAFVSATVSPTVQSDGSSNSQANVYGQVLAALSGLSVTQESSVGAALAALAPEVASGSLDAATKVDLVGAAVAASADAVAVGTAAGLGLATATATAAAWSAVISAASGGSASPTAADLDTLGIGGADSSAALGLVVSALRASGSISVASTDALSTLARAADNVVAAAEGSGSLTLQDLAALGVTGVTEADVAQVAQALAALGVSQLPTSVADLGSLVDTVTQDTTLPSLTVAARMVTDAGATADIGSGDTTRDATVRLSGTVSDAGGVASVRVYDGATVLGTATVGADGTWSFTTPTLSDGAHSLTARATDLAGNVTTSQALALTVDTVGPVITSAASATVDERQSQLYVASATDATSAAAGLQWVLSGADAALLQVDSAGRVTLRSGVLDYETKSSYSFTLQVQDVAGTITTLPVTVSIRDVVEGPVVSTGTGAVTEDSAPTVSGTLTATDVDNPALAFVAGTVDGDYGSLTVDAAGAWTYALGQNAEALAEGQVETDTITVELSDGTRTTVTITVTGTDDAPEVTVGEGAVTEDTSPTVSGSLSASDIENPALAFVAGTVAGTFGSLTVDAAGAWTYTLGSAAQALAGGQVATDTLTVALTDGTSTTVSITVTGTDDAPVIGDATASVVEDTAPTVSGSFNVTDVDGPTPVFYASSGVSQYGVADVRTDGTWTYTLDSRAQALAEGQQVVDVFMGELPDGTPASVHITITGTNDGPVAADDVTTVMEAGSLLTAQGGMGNVISGEDDTAAGRDRDPDTLDTLTVVAVRTGGEAGTGTAGVVGAVDTEGTPLVGVYGSLTIFADGSYRYDLNNALPAVQALGVGDLVTETFTYTVSDNHGATDTATLTVRVMGAADAPVLTTVTGTATEAGGTANSEPATDAIGNVLATATDPDSHPDSLQVTAVAALDATLAPSGTATAGQTLAGLYGSLVVEADGSYRYVVDDTDPLVQALLPGDTLVDHFDYTVTDGDGATSTARLDITIQGAEDAVALVLTGSASVSYVVGSGNVALFPGDPGIAVDYVDRTTGDGANTPDQFVAAFTITTGRHAGDVLSLQFGGSQAALDAATHATWDAVTGSLMVTVDAADGLDLASVYPQIFAALNFSTTDTTVGSSRQIQVDLDDGREQTSASVVLDLTLDSLPPSIVVDGSGTTAENQAYTAALTYSNATGAVTWALAGGDDAALFSIDGSGNLTLGARDFEAPADVGLDNTYRVIVQASDSAGHVQTQEVAVQVTNAEDVATSIAFGSPAFAGTEDTTMTFTGADLMSRGTFTDDGGVSLSALHLSSPSGTLMINGSAFNASTNFTVTADSVVTWRPASNLNGSSMLMFNAVAVASDGSLSAPVGVHSSVTAVPDASTLSLFAYPGAGYDVTLDAAQRAMVTSFADPDGPATSVSIAITSNYSPSLGDRLLVDETDLSNVNAGNFDYVWNADTGTLTITVTPGQTVTNVQWNSYLSYVRFQTSDDTALIAEGTPDSRSFQATVVSGPDDEVRTSATVTLNFTGNTSIGASAGAAADDSGDSDIEVVIDPGLGVPNVPHWYQPDYQSTLMLV